MSEVEFFSAASGQRPNAQLVLTGDERAVAARTGRAARWIGDFRTGENRQVVGRFIDSLNVEYGHALAGAAVGGTRLNRVLARGKPLRACEAMQAMRQGRSLVDELKRANERVADRYRANLPGDAGAQAMARLEARIEAARQSAFPEDFSVTGLVDCNELAERVSGAIVRHGRRGDSGARPVSHSRAERIATRVAEEALKSARDDALRRATAQLNPLISGSIGHAAVVAAFARNDPALEFDPRKLTPHAGEFLLNRFTSLLWPSPVYSADLFDGNRLQAQAEARALDFLSERQQARRAVRALAVAPAMEEALLEAVTWDNIPAQLVPHIGGACIRIVSRIAALSRPQHGERLAGNLLDIGGEIGAACRDSGLDIEAGARARMYAHAWRFLLRAVGQDQVLAIRRQLESSEGFLWGMVGGSRWYATEFANSEDAARTFGHGSNRRIYSSDSFRKAAAFSNTVLWLLAVLGEKPTAPNAGARPFVQPNQQQQHQHGKIVDTLRAIGIPCPAPGPLDGKRHCTISKDARAEIERLFAADIRAQGRLHRTGPFTGYMALPPGNGIADDVIPEYRFHGVAVPLNSGRVAIELKRFCTDENGRLNEDLLKKVSMAATGTPLLAVYGGCMNPRRPDLALFDGYVGGVTLGRRYLLSKAERGEVSLETREVIKPVYYQSTNQRDGSAGPLRMRGGEPPPNSVALDPNNSQFYARVVVIFVGPNHEPRIGDIDILYRFTSCRSQSGAAPQPRTRSEAGAGRRPRVVSFAVTPSTSFAPRRVAPERPPLLTSETNGSAERGETAQSEPESVGFGNTGVESRPDLELAPALGIAARSDSSSAQSDSESVRSGNCGRETGSGLEIATALESPARSDSPIGRRHSESVGTGNGGRESGPGLEFAIALESPARSDSPIGRRDFESVGTGTNGRESGSGLEFAIALESPARSDSPIGRRDFESVGSGNSGRESGSGLEYVSALESPAGSGSIAGSDSIVVPGSIAGSDSIAGSGSIMVPGSIAGSESIPGPGSIAGSESIADSGSIVVPGSIASLESIAGPGSIAGSRSNAGPDSIAGPDTAADSGSPAD